MIDALQAWKTTLAALPKVADDSWAMNFASWYAARIVSIQLSPAALVATGFLFTFPTSIFATALETLTPKDDPLSGIEGFADAWKDAVESVLTVCLPGTFKPPTSPATLFSVVTTTTIEPSSITAGHAKILELATAPPVANAMDSVFAEKFRDATLLLKIKVVGLNSLPPPPAGPGPQALTVAMVPLL